MGLIMSKRSIIPSCASLIVLFYMCSLRQAQRFLVTLSTEVAKRLQEAASKGRTITLKVLNQCLSIFRI